MVVSIVGTCTYSGANTRAAVAAADDDMPVDDEMPALRPTAIGPYDRTSPDQLYMCRPQMAIGRLKIMERVVKATYVTKVSADVLSH